MSSLIPLVSVCCITYNHEEFIHEAVDSFLMQETNFPIEIIIHDDASTDNTANIIREYQEKYSHLIKVILQTENQYTLRRFGFLSDLFNEARGKYIALCEGDDYWTDPLKLQKQVDFLEQHPECISCHHWHDYAYPMGDGEFKVVPAPTENQGYFPSKIATVREIFANKLRIKTRTHMFRNILQELPEWFIKVTFGDVPLSMILGKYGKFGFIDESMAVYRQTGQGVSSQGKDKSSFYVEHFIKWIEIWEYGLLHYNYEYSQEAVKTILNFYQRILQHYHFSYTVFKRSLLQATVKSQLSINLRTKIVSYIFMIFVYKKSRILYKKWLF